MSETRPVDHEEPGDGSSMQQSQAVAEFYPEHYEATGGRASPRLPHEMDEKALLATAMARFRPLNQPLPPAFDINSLPVYRAPVSHQDVNDADVDSTEDATSTHPDAEPPNLASEDAVITPSPTAVAAGNSSASQPASHRLACEWQGCSRRFEGADAPALLVSHINHEHIGVPVPGIKFNNPRCRWGNCTYNHAVRRFLVAHAMTHVPQYKIFFCTHCGRGFQQKAHLVSHERTHAKS